MIENFNKTNKKEYLPLLDFITNNINYDFYVTESNTRTYITDSLSLKKLFKNSEFIYTLEEKGDYVGIILVWKSVGGGQKRYYVKLNSQNLYIGYKLLTLLLWHAEQDLFVKIRKDSKYLNLFREKGFKFYGGRGCQMLLKRKKNPIKINKEEQKE